MQTNQTLTSRRPVTPAVPRLSRRAGFWAIAFSFLAVTAFSTAPSALYGLYEPQLAPAADRASRSSTRSTRRA